MIIPPVFQREYQQIIGDPITFNHNRHQTLPSLYTTAELIYSYTTPLSQVVITSYLEGTILWYKLQVTAQHPPGKASPRYPQSSSRSQHSHDTTAHP